MRIASIALLSLLLASLALAQVATDVDGGLQVFGENFSDENIDMISEESSNASEVSDEEDDTEGDDSTMSAEELAQLEEEGKIYGNYCGPDYCGGQSFKGAEGAKCLWSVKPKDSLDSCCQVHDQCCGNPATRNLSCNRKILECVKKASCRGASCGFAKAAIKATFSIAKNSVCGELMNPKNLIKHIGKGIKNAAKKVGGALKNAGKKIGGAVKKIFGRKKNAGKKAGAQVKKASKGIKKTGGKASKKVSKGIKKAGSKASKKVSKGIKKAGSKASKKVSKGIKKAGSKASKKAGKKAGKKATKKGRGKASKKGRGKASKKGRGKAARKGRGKVSKKGRGKASKKGRGKAARKGRGKAARKSRRFNSTRLGSIIQRYRLQKYVRGINLRSNPRFAFISSKRNSSRRVRRATRKVRSWIQRKFGGNKKRVASFLRRKFRGNRRAQKKWARRTFGANVSIRKVLRGFNGRSSRSAGPRLRIIVKHASKKSRDSRAIRLCSNTEISKMKGPKPKKCIVVFDLQDGLAIAKQANNVEEELEDVSEDLD